MASSGAEDAWNPNEGAAWGHNDGGTAGGGEWTSGDNEASGAGDGEFGGHATAGADDEWAANKSKHADSDDVCRNCGETGHYARDCTQPKKMTGECFNCGEVGHNKADCPNPKKDRPFDGKCRICDQEGHRAAECPQKPARVCKNCNQEGHIAAECTNPRHMDVSNVEEMNVEEAWKKLEMADKEKDMDDFKEAFKIYTKAVPTATYLELERHFRDNNFNTFIIARQIAIDDVLTNVNLQGKVGCKFVASFHYSREPKRPMWRAGWPASIDDNEARLQDAGETMDRMVPKCRRCGEMGHIGKSCKQEYIAPEKPSIKCFICGEEGHRARDCTQERVDPFACKNCKKPGHRAADCPEPPQTECRRCGQIGHFAKDCPEAPPPMTCRNCGEEGHKAADCPNERVMICRNCDKPGHAARDCPEPKDWSKHVCRNCGEKGHGPKRCPRPLKEEDNTGGFDGGAPAGDSSGGWGNVPNNGASGGWNDTSTEGPSGNWNSAPSTEAAPNKDGAPAKASNDWEVAPLEPFSGGLAHAASAEVAVADADW